MVYLELLKQSSWANEQVELYHFRDQHQHEVDIVLEYGDHQIIGVEIKASATIKPQDFFGLIKLAEFNPEKFKYGIVFYAGKDILPFSQKEIKLYALPISILFQ